MGGQIAHSIQNFGPQPRQVSQAAANALVAELRTHPPESIDLTCLMGDTEGYQLASILKQVLELSGWKINGVNQAIFNTPLKNIIIETPTISPAFVLLLNWFASLGLKPQGNHNKEINGAKLIIGGNI